MEKKKKGKKGNCVLSKCSGFFIRERVNCERLRADRREG